MLRRHAHGMPVSRSQNDLQGPQVGAKPRDRDLLMQIFICLRFHLELPFVQGGCQAPRLSTLSRILRRYEGARLTRRNLRRHAAHYEIVENRVQRFSLVTSSFARPAVALHRRILALASGK
jgi:hypothetical protein